jgi:glutathione-regulated potassium-efflux system ancillary protein KefG
MSPVDLCRLKSVIRRVSVRDLIDAAGVAAQLGLRHRNSVSTYMNRYPDFPRPVVDTGTKRCRLWSRTEVDGWLRSRREAGKVRGR